MGTVCAIQYNTMPNIINDANLIIHYFKNQKIDISMMLMSDIQIGFFSQLEL